MIISATSPTPEGEMLWRVCIEGTYWDSDPRMPGMTTTGKTVYVLATSMQEALTRAELYLVETRKDITDHLSTTATIVTIEALKAATTLPRPLIGYTTQQLVEIKLTIPEDAKRYRLGVCLIPI